MGIENNIFAKRKATQYSLQCTVLSFSHPWTRETRSNEFWVFSKVAYHLSLIPRSSQLFKMAVESNFPPWGSWMSKSRPTGALQSLIPLGCPTPQSWGKPLISALCDGAISHNRPQIASDHTIHKKSRNSQKIAHYSQNQP